MLFLIRRASSKLAKWAMRMILLLDLGATHMRFGWATARLSLPFAVVPTPDTSDGIVEAICMQVQKMEGREGERVTSLAIGCPGLVDQAGFVHKALYIALGGVDLQEVLKQRLQRPVVVLNDAKAQALGCVRKGEALAYIVIGTAIGGGYVDNDRLIGGENGFAGEVGHIPLGNSTRHCTCGRYGCLDTTASGRYLAERLGQKWWTLPRTAEMMDLLNCAGRDIGEAAVLLGTLFASTRIVIAGHICDHEEFREGVLARWSERIWGSASLEFHVDTWPFAWMGLSRVAEMGSIKRKIVYQVL